MTSWKVRGRYGRRKKPLARRHFIIVAWQYYSSNERTTCACVRKLIHTYRKIIGAIIITARSQRTANDAIRNARDV